MDVVNSLVADTVLVRMSPEDCNNRDVRRLVAWFLVVCQRRYRVTLEIYQPGSEMLVLRLRVGAASRDAAITLFETLRAQAARLDWAEIMDDWDLWWDMENVP